MNEEKGGKYCYSHHEKEDPQENQHDLLAERETTSKGSTFIVPLPNQICMKEGDPLLSSQEALSRREKFTP